MRPSELTPDYDETKPVNSYTDAKMKIHLSSCNGDIHQLTQHSLPPIIWRCVTRFLSLKLIASLYALHHRHAGSASFLSPLINLAKHIKRNHG